MSNSRNNMLSITLFAREVNGTTSQIITLLIALVTACIAWRTFVIQGEMSRRDLEYRKERARLTVNIIWRGLHLIVTSIAGASSNDIAEIYGARWDVLEGLQGNFSEIAWIPDCEWKTMFVDIMTHALPKGSMGSAAHLEANLIKLNQTYSQLGPGGPLYNDCMKAIDRMK